MICYVFNFSLVFPFAALNIFVWGNRFGSSGGRLRLETIIDSNCSIKFCWDFAGRKCWGGWGFFWGDINTKNISFSWNCLDDNGDFATHFADSKWNYKHCYWGIEKVQQPFCISSIAIGCYWGIEKVQQPFCMLCLSCVYCKVRISRAEGLDWTIGKYIDGNAKCTWKY